MSKLIIIRGPCGAGKSTVAKTLMERVTEPTVLISRDQYMFMFQVPEGTEVPDKELIENNILICLDHGFDVIFEGNFKITTHNPMLERLLNVHPKENYIFYLDVSLPETLRRHGSRKEKIITVKEMKKLYDYAVPMKHSAETIIPEDYSLEKTVQFIQKKSGI